MSDKEIVSRKDWLKEEINEKRIELKRLITARVGAKSETGDDLMVLQEQIDMIEQQVAELEADLKIEEGKEVIKLPPFVVNDNNPVMSFAENIDWSISILDIPRIHKEFGLTGKGVKVAVLDTACDKDHEDLQGAVIEFHNTTSEPYPNNRDSFNGHGIATASLIGARRNDMGILSVAPECQIIAIKCLFESGSGTMVDITEAINLAVDRGAHIINLSLGGASSTPSLEQAVKRAASRGIYVICAAGNSGGDNTVGYPGRYEQAYAVAAINSQKRVSAFSSRGMEVDISAPGERVLCAFKNSGYATISGTCIRGDQWVHTNEGYKEISKIEIGDLVETFNEDTHQIELRSVTNKISNGIKTVYNVKTQNGEIACTDNHPFMQGYVADAGLRNTEGQRSYQRDLRWTQLKDLKEGDIILQNQIKKDSVHSDNVLNRVKKVLPFFNLDTAYSLGYWLGDGWFRPNGLVAYAKNAFWEELVSRFEKGFPENEVTSRYREDRNEYNVYVNGSELKSNLISIGLIGGAKNKEIPSFVFGLPLEYREAVLAGIFDSDGSINDYENGRNAVLKVSSPKFAKGFKRLMESMNIRCSNIFEQTKQGGQIRGRQLPETTSYSSTTYQFYKLKPISKFLLTVDYVDLIDKHDDDTLSQNSTGRVKLNGVKVRPPELENKDLYFGKIVEIRELGEEEVWDITVEGNHNFLCENFVVHNSFASPIVAGCFALFKQGGIKLPPRLLSDTAIDIEEPGRDNRSGSGIINPYEIIKKYYKKIYANEAECVPPVVRVTELSKTSAKLEWVDGTPAVNYTVFFGQDFEEITGDKQWVFDDLLPGTKYVSEVRSNCEFGISSNTVVEFTTLNNDGSPPINPPTPPVVGAKCEAPVVQITNLTTTSAKFEWPTANAFNYHVFFGTNIDILRDKVFELTGLQPDTRYSLGVRSNCSNGISAVTPVEFTTKSINPQPSASSSASSSPSESPENPDDKLIDARSRIREADRLITEYLAL